MLPYEVTYAITIEILNNIKKGLKIMSLITCICICCLNNVNYMNDISSPRLLLQLIETVDKKRRH